MKRKMYIFIPSCGKYSHKKLSTFLIILIILIYLTFLLEYSRTIQNYEVYPTNRIDIKYQTKQDPMNIQTTKPRKTSSVPGACEFVGKNGQASPFLARRFPHIIIIGFGKAGTRATYQMIRMHPDVAGPPHEMRYFSNDAKYKQGIKSYIEHMPFTNSAQKTIEKSPDYIINRKAAVRLQKALMECNRIENIRFIVVLRDPFDRAVSEYISWKIDVFNTKKKVLPPFERKCVVNNTGKINSRNKQVNASIYSYHLENWLKLFEMKQMCFVDGSVLVKNPYLEIKKLERCLELRSFIQPGHFYYNNTRGFYCPVETGGQPKCLSKSKGKVHPKIDVDVERKLRDFFMPFNKKLYNLTGVNYGWA